MPARTLTEVAVEVFADLKRLRAEAIAGGRKAGEDAGEQLGEGIARGADGKLRDSRGRFVASGRSAGDSFSKGLIGSLSGGTFAKVIATMAAKFSLVGGAAAAAAPGVGQIVAALTPAAGAVNVLPAALLAVAAASGTVKLATAGVGDAIKAGFGDNAEKAKESLKGLSVNARSFATQIIALQPQLKTLQKTVANRLFLPLLNDIRPVAQLYLPMLRQEMGNLAGPLGGIGEQILKTAKTSEVFNGVRALFVNTGYAVVRLRDSIDPLATALGALIQATAPELPKLATGFSDIAKRVGDYITAASESGRVTAAFEAGKQVLKDLGAILGNVGSIIGSVYRSATENGNSLLANLRELTGQAAAFFRSAEGGSAMTAVFSTLGTLGQALRTSLAAVLPAIGQSIQILGPAIAGLAGPAATLVTAIAPLLPIAAGLAATVIKELTPAISSLAGWLAQNEGVVKGVAAALVAYGVAMRVAAAITAVQGAGSIAAWIAQTTIATNLTKIWTALQYAFGVAMRFALGPIGLVITAVGLLVAAVVYAYNHHEGFRNLVQKVWAAIQAAVKATVDWIVNTAWPWLQKAWDAIAAGAKWMWEKGIKPAVGALVDFWKNVIAPTAMWLWHNVIEPVFEGVSWAVKAAMAVIELVIAAVVAYWKTVLAPTAMWLWKNVIKPAFDAISAVIKGNIKVATDILDALVAFFKDKVAPVFTWFWKKVVVPVFNGVKDAISDTWNDKIKPVLQALGDFVRDKVVPVFKAGVEGIGKAWETIKDLAKKPVNFVINSVINPLIGGFNKVAGVFGTTKIDPLPGLAEGGRIPGNSGGRDDRIAQMVGRGGKLMGSIKVASGEFVVNARDTARALPLLRWINAGMRGGPNGAEQRIGRPMADRPGDGSEGWAFARGGLVGFLSNVTEAITNPKASIVRPIENALKDIPGGGIIRSLLIGMGKKLADGFVSWLGGATGGGDGGNGGRGVPGNLGKAMRFVSAQNGKPYLWASAGPRGYDCSGIVSAAWNILHGRSPYSHTFSTASLPGPYFPKRGPGGLLTAGWAHPGQRGASANVGHMAGQFLGGMSFESTGSRGVHVNSGRRPADFAHMGHFARGGLLGGIAKVARADFGSVTLARGWNMVQNATGAPEPLSTGADADTLEVLRAILAAIVELAPGLAAAMGATTPGLLRHARRI